MVMEIWAVPATPEPELQGKRRSAMRNDVATDAGANFAAAPPTPQFQSRSRDASYCVSHFVVEAMLVAQPWADLHQYWALGGSVSLCRMVPTLMLTTEVEPSAAPE